MKRWLFFLLFILMAPHVTTLVQVGSWYLPAIGEEQQGGVITRRATSAPREELTYDVFWLGMKTAELIMRLPDVDDSDTVRTIWITASANHVFTLIHPGVDDFFIDIKGHDGMPIKMEQVRTLNGVVTKRKLTLYDQASGRLEVRRNNDPPEIFLVSGPVHNEFTSFLSLRRHALVQGQSFVVPTFADEKRHEVVVDVREREEMESLFGKVEVMKVRPKLNFKGLYDKTGDPVIWFTNDERTIPIRINAKVLIGSLSAILREYKKSDAVDGEGRLWKISRSWLAPVP